MTHYVYQVVHRQTGVWYIGIRSTSRCPTKDGYRGSGTRIKQVLAKDGAAAFSKTILAVTSTRKEAASIEAFLVGPEQLTDPLCLNLCLGGDVGTLGSKMPLCWIEKNRLRNRGRKATALTRARMSKSYQDNPHSQETLEKLRDRMKGNLLFVGRKHTPETRELLRQALRKSWLTRAAESVTVVLS